MSPVGGGPWSATRRRPSSATGCTQQAAGAACQGTWTRWLRSPVTAGATCAASVLAGTRDGSWLLTKEPITVPRRSRTMKTTIQSDNVTVKITANDKGNPAGKLADAELHFAGGPLSGLKLSGFAIWERRGAGGRNVTFPAR